MADNKKQEKDFTKEVDELLSQVGPVVKVGLSVLLPLALAFNLL